MKTPLIFLCIVCIVISCSSDDTVPMEEPETLTELGSGFRKVDYSYSDIQDNIQYVNNAPGVKKINSDKNGVKAQHWVYKSPSLNNQEIGFSVAYSEECENSPCDVILFLHGSKGSENAGSTLFFDYYYEYESNKPRAFIFANGIYAPESPIPSGVWKSRTFDDLVFDHPQQLVELIGGIIEDSSLFPFMKTDMNNWSVTGFSAGGSGVMGVYMDPTFATNEKYQPMHAYPLGGWMSDSMNSYFDFIGGLDRLKKCTEEDQELIVANHLEDDVDCVGKKQFNNKEYFVDNFTEKEIPFTYLGLTDDVASCEMGSDHNPAHSIKFYLRNSIQDALKYMNCKDTTYLEEYEVLGDLLFRDY